MNLLETRLSASYQLIGLPWLQMFFGLDFRAAEVAAEGAASRKSITWEATGPMVFDAQFETISASLPLLISLMSYIKSLGMLKFPTEWKNDIHVPNHQPVSVF